MTTIVKFTSSCLWCENEIPWKQAVKGKLICSVKCMKRINESLPSDEYNYDINDVQV